MALPSHIRMSGEWSSEFKTIWVLVQKDGRKREERKRICRKNNKFVIIERAMSYVRFSS